MEAIAEQGSSLLDSISAFCRGSGIAESTFGRRAVNDGKFVARLRDGKFQKNKFNGCKPILEKNKNQQNYHVTEPKELRFILLFQDNSFFAAASLRFHKK